MPNSGAHGKTLVMKIGYARVSTHEQNLDLQRDALLAVGCEKVITDKASGTTATRPGLEKLKEQMRAGDTLVVWRLDRLGRSLRDLIGWMTYLDEHKVGLLSLHEAIDTTTGILNSVTKAMALFPTNPVAPWAAGLVYGIGGTSLLLCLPLSLPHLRHTTSHLHCRFSA